MHQASVTYANGRTAPVKNMGYILRRWKEISELEVKAITQSQLPRTGLASECELFVRFNNKDVYKIEFHTPEILWVWLSRPTLIGAPLIWFGLKTVCGSKAPDVLDFLNRQFNS